MTEFISDSESATLEFGRNLGESMKGGEIITLSGDLGAGKTVLTKGIALGLGINESVLSPTFTLMNEYDGRIKLFHYDAYRLRSAQEAYEAGLTEYFGDKSGVCVIEWWENIAQSLSFFHCKHITITKMDDNTRIIKVVDE